MQDIVGQILAGSLYYGFLILLTRLAGKRLAGQMTTFDLIVLIGLAVVLQQIFLGEGRRNAAVFLVTVFSLHWLSAAACARWAWLRHLLRGQPRQLVRHGEVLEEALRREGVSAEELQAGLRKLGYQSAADVELAVIEETGHITAVGKSGAQP